MGTFPHTFYSHHSFLLGPIAFLYKSPPALKYTLPALWFTSTPPASPSRCRMELDLLVPLVAKGFQNPQDLRATLAMKTPRTTLDT